MTEIEKKVSKVSFTVAIFAEKNPSNSNRGITSLSFPGQCKTILLFVFVRSRKPMQAKLLCHYGHICKLNIAVVKVVFKVSFTLVKFAAKMPAIVPGELLA